MARINGKEELWVGGVFTLHSAQSFKKKIPATHILSAIPYQLESSFNVPEMITHKVIDLQDTPDEDILSHIPEAVRFIEYALYPSSGVKDSSGSAASVTGEEPVNCVFVHCVMGKSRSVTFIVAWLLYKFPQRWRLSGFKNSKKNRLANTTNGATTSDGGTTTPTEPNAHPSDAPETTSVRPLSSPAEAVDRAIQWVRDSQPFAEPNEGFHQQLQLWWQMGCPIQPGAMERNPVYRRWLYKREVQSAVEAGMAPRAECLTFEDELSCIAQEHDGSNQHESTDLHKPQNSSSRNEYRCSKCRCRICDSKFVSTHSWCVSQSAGDKVSKPDQKKHTSSPIYTEPLSWMRGALEKGELEGRLVCPGRNCGSNVGRYSWKGQRCVCNEWISPSFMLQRAKVDEFTIPATTPDESTHVRLPTRTRPRA